MGPGWETLSRGFALELWNDAAEIWQAQHGHPFVEGLANGTLDRARFTHYLQQDLAFVHDYGRFLALGCARATSPPDARRLAQMAAAALGPEVDFHYEWMTHVGGTAEDLAGFDTAAVTRSYCDFFLRVAAVEQLAVIAAALLPCLLAYYEIPQRLLDGEQPAERYRGWLAAYVEPSVREDAEWCHELVNRSAHEGSPGLRDAMRDAYLTSAGHELAFWNLVWEGPG
jgi:thiaminase (transcriptional activator TenA)